MNPRVRAFLLAPTSFQPGPGSILICGSVPPGVNHPTFSLRADAAWLFLSADDWIPTLPGYQLAATAELPETIPAAVAAGHGTLCLALLALASGLEFKQLWFVHHDVYLAGSWPEFLEVFDDSNADLLAPLLRSRKDDPGWSWWPSLVPPEGAQLPDEDRQLASLATIFRISRQALDAADNALAEGWVGHFEALLPTSSAIAGLAVEDIGGNGPFTPPSRVGRYYDGGTFSPDFPRRTSHGFLHYPVPPPTSRPSAYRFRRPAKKLPRVLYFCPVGPGAVELMPATLERFGEAGADALLIEYAPSGIVAEGNVRLVSDRGQKWELARRHLHPNTLDGYDHVFVWDDDIGIGDFDVARFLRIMDSNRLDMAQPSLVSPHPVCHGITRQQPCPPPLGTLGRVGRLTNFVEIMVPVFTRDCWTEFYSYLGPESRTGWGLDSLPLGRKGIVDCMHVVHTRACNDHGPGAFVEMQRFLNSNGLFELRHHDLGYLLEELPALPARP